MFRFNQCYGVLGVLDRLHGTDDKFRKTKEYERHTLLLSLTPLTKSIPDTPQNKSDVITTPDTPQERRVTSSSAQTHPKKQE